jgi:glycosyltransferase involved in cell wall biosynthesis
MDSSLKPLVSVVMITYKHENFIAEAIQGVLMQVCDFEVELIIADDCSPDDTEKIVQQYITTHQKGSWIKYHRHQKNIGMMPNFMFALMEAQGEYIALCEGDDFWTDSLKLQKQVEKLKSNPSIMICTHDAYTIDLKNGEKSFPFELSKECYTFQEVINHWFPTASILLRNGSINFNHKIFQKSICGDLPILALGASFGGLINIPEKMSNYRIHSGGISNSLSQQENIYFYKNRIWMYSEINKITNEVHDSFLKRIQFDFFKKIKNSIEYNEMNRFKRLKILFLFQPFTVNFYKIFRAEWKHSIKLIKD